MMNHSLAKLAFMQTLIAIAVVVACLIAAPARADFSGQLFKLTAADATTDDLFGWSVGVSNNIAIVGAHGDDDAGNLSGSAYLFDVATGQQLSKLIASDAAADAVFGSSVGISGHIAIVGAPNGNVTGAAYLFDVITGQELFKLTAADAPTGSKYNFGKSVAISGNIAVVGAPFDDHAGYGSGSAYLFDVTTGQQLAKLTVPGASPSDLFGLSVAISGNTAIIGSPHDHQLSGTEGAAYLFDVTTGQQLGMLTTSDAGAFGQSVAISGNIALVGRLADQECCGHLNAAYLFDITTGQQLFQLTGSEPGGFLDTFLFSVAISGNKAMVGEFTLNDGAGVAHLYDVTTGKELMTLTASDAAASDNFGIALAISGNTAIVGAVGGEFGAPDRIGAAYVFSLVPEPSSLALLALGLPLLIMRISRWPGHSRAFIRRRFVPAAIRQAVPLANQSHDRVRRLRITHKKERENTLRKHSTVLIRASLAALLALLIAAPFARADIFQWQYVNPADPSLGKTQSTTLCVNGAGANAGPGAVLANLNLTKAYLSGVNLGGDIYSENSGVEGADLTGANLSQADLTGVDFSGAYITSVDWAGYPNNYLSYPGASLLDANFTGADVRGANFTWAGISFAQLYSTANYQAHDLSGITFGQSLAGANLAGQNFAGASFTGSLHTYNGYGPGPIETDLTGANLTNANFAGADLAGANLSGADARGALNLSAVATNLIRPNGHIAGLELFSEKTLTVRNYHEAAAPKIVIDQHLAMDATGLLQMEFDAAPWNSLISFAPGIPVTRGGTLQLTFAPDVNLASQIGRTLDLFDWTGVSPTGAFTVSSPYTWNLSKLYTTGEVTLSAFSAIPGDFNNNGVVDAADYIAWRKIDGTLAGHNVWRSHFGQSASGSGASVNTTVPEPATLLMLIVAAAASIPLWCRRIA